MKGFIQIPVIIGITVISLLSGIVGVLVYQDGHQEQGIAVGIPYSQSTQDVIPFETQKYYVGSSSPTSLEYKGGFFQDLTVSGTCTGCGGSSFGDLGDVATSSDATGDIWYLNSSGQIKNLGAGSNGQVLTLASGLPSWAAPAGGGGGGSGLWATTTDADLLIRPTDTSDVVVIGDNATSSTGYIFEVVGTSLFDGATFSGSTTIDSNLVVTGQLSASSTATSTFANGLDIDEGCFAINGICVVDTDTDTGDPFAWTVTGYGVSTSTILGFTQGFLSNASSTISASTTITGILTASGGVYGDLTGNADTATALAANGGNCAAGSYPLGVDASGAVESCTDATTEIDSAISTHAGVNNAHQALVTLAGTPNYLTLSGQEITLTVLDTSDDTNLGATWPVVLTDDTLSFDGLSTSTSPTIGNLPYFSGVNTFDNVATSSVTAGTGIASSATLGALVGGSNTTLSIDFTEFDTDSITEGSTNFWSDQARWDTFWNASTTLSSVTTLLNLTDLITTNATATNATTTNLVVDSLSQVPLYANSSGLIVSAGSGSSGNCIQWGANNTLVDSGAGCGGGSGDPFAWTVTGYGVSTSTTLGFTQGFVSNASSTVSASTTITGELTLGSAINIGGESITDFAGDNLTVTGGVLNAAGGGGTFAWTPYADGNATSTLLRFDAGFISQSSSTIDSNLTITGNSTTTNATTTDIHVSGGIYISDDYIKDFAGTNLSVDASGVLNATGAAGDPFAWDVEGYGVSTSTTLGFNQGFVSNASSTISASSTITGELTLSSGINISDDTINDFNGTGLTVTGNALTVDLNELTTETSIAAGDFIGMVDITDSGSGKITFSNFESTLDLANLTGTLGVGNGGTGVTSLDDIVGTANQITVTNGAGTIIGGDATLSLPNLIIQPYASTTALSVFNQAAFGATATSTFDSAGVLTLIGNFVFDGTTHTGTSGIDPTLISGTATNGECAEFNGDGDIVGAGAACGTGGGSFSWDIETWGVSTSTTLTFNQGFTSNASSTVAASTTITGELTLGSAINISDDNITDFAGTGLTVTGGSLDVDASQTQITAIGTITTGTWNGTTIAVANGGTGATTLNDLITLTTHTTGNYTATIADAGNSTITVTNGTAEGGAVTLDLTANGVDDTHIDWGTGASQVSIADLSGNQVSGALVWDLGGATSFELPNDGTVNAEGECTIDTTSGQLRCYGGGSQKVFDSRRALSFAHASTTQGSGTTTKRLGVAPFALTVNTAECDFGDFMGISLYDGTNRADYFEASSTIGEITFTSNNTFTDGEAIRVDVGTSTDINASVNGGCTFGITVDAD